MYVAETAAGAKASCCNLGTVYRRALGQRGRSDRGNIGARARAVDKKALVVVAVVIAIAIHSMVSGRENDRCALQRKLPPFIAHAL